MITILKWARSLASCCLALQSLCDINVPFWQLVVHFFGATGHNTWVSWKRLQFQSLPVAAGCVYIHDIKQLHTEKSKSIGLGINAEWFFCLVWSHKLRNSIGINGRNFYMREGKKGFLFVIKGNRTLHERGGVVLQQRGWTPHNEIDKWIATRRI